MDLAPQLRKHRDQVKPEDLTTIPKYHAVIRLLQNGMPEQPFSMVTIPPEPIADDRSELVRRVSNARYAISKRAEHRESGTHYDLTPVLKHVQLSATQSIVP